MFAGMYLYIFKFVYIRIMRSKTLVYSPFPGIAGSNPAGGMDVYLLC
jgi:hypothetical protein